jgi:hypothetical protein
MFTTLLRKIKNEMGGAYDTYERYEKCIQGFGGDTSGKEVTCRRKRRREYNIKVDL